MPPSSVGDYCAIRTALLSLTKSGAGCGSLCGSCKHAHLYRRRDKLDPAVYCHELSPYVPPVIVVQSVPRVAALSLRQMQEIARPIDPRPGVIDGSYR